MLHGPDDLRLDDVPDPIAGRGELVIDVLVALTCATDAKMMRVGAHPALGPLPTGLGHEVVGVVSQVGAGVRGHRSGDAVVVANSAPCLECPECRSSRPNLCRDITYLTGAFAEQLLVPERIVTRNTHALPEGLDPRQAAAAEPLACALNTARRCESDHPRHVLILGGGVQGQLLTSVITARGDHVTLLDPHDDRRGRALAAGAAVAEAPPEDASQIESVRSRLGAGAGADLVVEAVGRPEAWRLAVELARPGGEVIFHGGCPVGSRVDLPTGPLHYGELTLRGSYHHTPQVFGEALALIADGDVSIDELLHAPISLADVPGTLRASRGEKHPVMPRAD